VEAVTSVFLMEQHLALGKTLTPATSQHSPSVGLGPSAHSEHGAPLTWAVVIGFTEWADKVDQSDENG
jgi:hypothetical protein